MKKEKHNYLIPKKRKDLLPHFCSRFDSRIIGKILILAKINFTDELSSRLPYVSYV